MKGKIIQGFATVVSIVVAVASTTVFAKEATIKENIDGDTVIEQEASNDNLTDSDDGIVAEEGNVKSESDSKESMKEDLAKELSDGESEEDSEDSKDAEETELEEAYEQDKDIEISKQKLSGKIAGYKISIEGDFPENAKLSLKETGDPVTVIRQIEKAFDSAYGYFEVASFNIDMSYEEDGDVKHFVPSDYNDSCKLTVEEGNRSESLCGFSLEDNKALKTENGKFIITDEESITLGVKYEYDTSICGKAPEGATNATIYAKGDGVTYSTKSDRNGWYLFTDVDYSNAYMGCSFQITTDN